MDNQRVSTTVHVSQLKCYIDRASHPIRQPLEDVEDRDLPNLVPRAFPIEIGRGMPSQILREKPWARGCDLPKDSFAPEQDGRLTDSTVQIPDLVDCSDSSDSDDDLDEEQ